MMFCDVCVCVYVCVCGVHVCVCGVCGVCGVHVCACGVYMCVCMCMCTCVCMCVCMCVCVCVLERPFHSLLSGRCWIFTKGRRRNGLLSYDFIVQAFFMIFCTLMAVMYRSILILRSICVSQ